MGRSLIQRSPTDCDVSLCDLETSRIRQPWPTLGCCTREKIRQELLSNSLSEKQNHLHLRKIKYVLLCIILRSEH
jgi:hypothetical protein